MKKRIISKVTFLGLNFYKRVRLEEKEILFGNKYDQKFNLGLYPLKKYPKLEYDYISLFQQKDWDKTVDELFYKAFCHLFYSNEVNVFLFKDKKHFLFNCFTLSQVGYELKTQGNVYNEDVFLNLILKKIYQTNSKYKEKSDLESIIEEIINDSLGSKVNEYNNPEKKFITNLLTEYAKKYSWIKLEKESKYLGMISKYKVNIDVNKLNALKKGFRKLNELSINERNSNIEFIAFEKELSRIVSYDFKRRYPSNDNDNDTDTDLD
jgi:hypothetical protein